VRPVKFGLRAGTPNTSGNRPGYRERSAAVDWPGKGRQPAGRARPCSIPARSRAAAASSPKPTRSTYTRLASSPGGWKSSTRTGTSSPSSPVGSLAKAARHSASPNLEPK
jgi:hypothetical protein